METKPAAHDSGDLFREATPLRLVIVSEVCFLCEALAATLERDRSVLAVRCATPAETVAQSLAAQADVLLVDGALRDGPDTVRRLRQIAPDRPIVAYGVQETGEEVIAWAEAGVTGYLPNTARLDQIAQLVHDILSGEFLWPGRVVARLLRRLAAAAANFGDSTPSPARQLTRRERQVAELIAARLADKDIARQLNVSLTTTKTHVHNLLGKLGVEHRADVADALRGRLSAR